MSGEQGDDLEAWEARDQAVDEVARAAIKAGLDGTLSWAQVDDVLTGLGYGQESELADPEDGLSSPAEGRSLTEDERAAAENRAAADYRMAMETAELEREREFERWMEVER
jgi:hypothetical protein